ncbi:MAG: hypothetical protein FWC09_08245 [Lachnospiraceae bacterium]|nr:hypothetical protein [Lachnospiraceae bacterium]
MKKHLETGLMILCTAAFFGFIYPELCLTSDTVNIKIEAETANEKDPDITNLYINKFNIPPEQIRIRFRIRDMVNERKLNDR